MRMIDAEKLTDEMFEALKSLGITPSTLAGMKIFDVIMKQPTITQTNGKCWYCGGQLCWESDFDWDDVYQDGKAGIVTYLHCIDCGARVEHSLCLEKEEE